MLTPELLWTYFAYIFIFSLPFILFIYGCILEEEEENIKKYKSNYEKKKELVIDAERILEIKEEFDNLNRELEYIQWKYKKRLFSFLKK